MPCKLDFDNPNRGYIIDAYLDALSDRYDMEKIKRSQLGYPETGVSYSDHTEMEVTKMQELIDRQAALEIAMSYCPDDDGCCSKAGHDIREMLDEIEALPTIEPDVRHGSWETWGYVFHGIEWKRCSRCGKCADVSYYGLLDGQIKMSTPAICGGCGARMDATDTNVGGKGDA